MSKKHCRANRQSGEPCNAAAGDGSLFEDEMLNATITRCFREAISRGDLTKDKGYYSKNAQMLTSYSNEHLSINQEDEKKAA